MKVELANAFGNNADRVTLYEHNDHMQVNRDNRRQIFRIHMHYNSILRFLFEDRGHSHVLIVEDDLQLAPTSLHFIRQIVPVVDADPSLIGISLFNDNAFVLVSLFTLVRRRTPTPSRSTAPPPSPISDSSSTATATTRSGGTSPSPSARTVGLVRTSHP